jgi:hypothetical protein
VVAEAVVAAQVALVMVAKVGLLVGVWVLPVRVVAYLVQG